MKELKGNASLVLTPLANSSVVELGQFKAFRLPSIDAARGMVMVLMTLDHARDFFHNYSQFFSPTDLSTTTPAIFLTRWITHFCAPTFVFLAGLSVFLRQKSGASTNQLASFLVKRGVLLIILEVSLVRLAWDFTPRPYFYAQIMWVLGWGMLLLSCVFRPKNAVAIVLVLAVFGVWMGPITLARILLGAGTHDFGGGAFIRFGYPIISWFVVMLAGYLFGKCFLLPAPQRKKALALSGLLAIGTFVLMRSLQFGDSKWAVQTDFVGTAISFVNCTKIPVSIPYLLMTLGPLLLFLAVGDVVIGALRPLVVIGRAPLMFYVSHLYVLHVLAVASTAARRQNVSWALPFTIWFPPPRDSNFGFNLPVVYLVTSLVVVALYPLCGYIYRQKRSGKHKWLAYL